MNWWHIAVIIYLTINSAVGIMWIGRSVKITWTSIILMLVFWLVVLHYSGFWA